MTSPPPAGSSRGTKRAVPRAPVRRHKPLHSQHTQRPCADASILVDIIEGVEFRSQSSHVRRRLRLVPADARVDRLADAALADLSGGVQQQGRMPRAGKRPMPLTSESSRKLPGHAPPQPSREVPQAAVPAKPRRPEPTAAATNHVPPLVEAESAPPAPDEAALAPAECEAERFLTCAAPGPTGTCTSLTSSAFSAASTSSTWSPPLSPSPLPRLFHHFLQHFHAPPPPPPLCPGACETSSPSSHASSSCSCR